MDGTRFFHYRTGSSVLHRLSPPIKLVVLVALALGAFSVPVQPALLCWLVVLVLSLVLQASIKAVLADLRPVLLYFCLLYASSLILHALAWYRAMHAGETYSLHAFFMPEVSYLPLFVHVALSLAITSFLYRTTSNMQLHEGFATLERALTHKKRTDVADTLSLTLTFIPRIVTNWQRIDAAWNARGGKNSVRKLLVLIPLLFSVSMKDAYDTALAIENRR